MKHEFDILATLHDIRDLLKKQNQILEENLSNSNNQTKITVVGTSGTTNSKGLKSDEDFSL